MAEIDKVILDVLEKLPTEMTGFNQRMDKFEQHFGNFKRRQTAAMHFEQSVIAHLAGIHEGMDELRAVMRAVRSDVRKVGDRLDRVEVR